MAAKGLNNVSCADFAQFQEVLKEMRMIDDKIIYNLNKIVPTTSFKGQVDATQKCQGFYSELSSAYASREKVIKGCISEVSTSINHLKQQKDQNPDDFKVMKDLRKRQAELRLMQSELNIEEVVKDRSLRDVMPSILDQILQKRLLKETLYLYGYSTRNVEAIMCHRSRIRYDESEMETQKREGFTKLYFTQRPWTRTK